MPRSRHSPKSARIGRDAVTRIGQACRQAVAGKLAVRQLARWVDGFGVGETEFRLMWTLFPVEESPSPMPRCDQAELAERLAVSAAQVSCVVERLRGSQLLERDAAEGDRRRQVWRLTAAGLALVRKIVAAVDALPATGESGREAA